MTAQPTRIGSYEIVQPLGRGGMGTVYLARDPAIDRLVALKLLRDGLDAPDLRERFAREARSAGRLRHPNIVTIFHIGEHESQPYIVMEYIPGQTLADIIQHRHALSITRKLKIIEDLCNGLAYAHKAGIVHRDIKPANIVVDSDGLVKILDFGIARAGEQGLTRLGTVMGTPRYMAPEQLDPGTADARSDEFSVGLVLYELLTFTPAFSGDTFVVMNKILREQPEPLERYCPGIDPTIVAIVKRALEKDPKARYQDLSLMRADLARAGARLIDDAVDSETVISEPGGKDHQPAFSRGTVAAADLADTVAAAGSTTSSNSIVVAARKVFEAGDFQRAIELSEQIAPGDSNYEGAVELIRKARRRLTLRKARTLLDTVRQQLVRGDLAAAPEGFEEASTLDLTGETAADLRTELVALQNAVGTAQKQARAVRESIEEARAQLHGGALESASRSIDRAISVDPNNTEALDIRAAIAAAVEAEIREQTTLAIIARARQSASTDAFDAAVEDLQSAPDDPRVRAAIEEIKKQKGEAQRVAEEQRRRLHAEAVSGEIAAARATADQGDPASALKRLAAIRFDASDFPSDTLAPLQAKAAALAARCESSVCLDAAHRELADGRFAEAAALLERAREWDAGHPELEAVSRAIADGIQAEEMARRRQQLDALVARVAAVRTLADKRDVAGALNQLEQIQFDVPDLAGDELAQLKADAARLSARLQATVSVDSARGELDKGRFERASELLEQARGRDADHPELGALRGEIEAAVEADRAARRRQELDRLAAAVTLARTAADKGDPADALERLAQVQLDVPHLAGDELTRLKKDAERLTAYCQAGLCIETGRRELSGGLLQEAADLLERAKGWDPKHPALKALAKDIRAKGDEIRAAKEAAERAARVALEEEAARSARAAKEEAERAARAEELRAAKEQAERTARLAKEEAERLARAEETRAAKEQAERTARLAKEEAERAARAAARDEAARSARAAREEAERAAHAEERRLKELAAAQETSSVAPARNASAETAWVPVPADMPVPMPAPKRRSNLQWGAAGFLVVILVGGILWWRREPPTATAPVATTAPANPGPQAATAPVNRPPEATPAPVSPPPASTNPAPSPVAPVETPVAPSPGTAAPASNDAAVAALRRRFAATFGRRDYASALQSIVDATALNPNNAAVQRDLDQLLSTTRQETTRSFDQTKSVSADARAQADYQTATRLRSDAATFARTGRKIDAVRSWLGAKDALARAAAVPGAPTTPRVETQPRPEPPPQASTQPPATVPPPAPRPETTVPEPDRPAPPSNQPSPPPVETRPPTTTPPVDTAARDRAAIEGVLQQYRDAYQRLDAKALARVWPSMPPTQEQIFASTKSYTLEILRPQIVVQGDSATVTCVRRIASRPEVGREQTASPPTVFTLRRAGGSWIIVGVR